jgi:hypothetical protein
MTDENKTLLSGFLKYLFDNGWKINAERHHNPKCGWLKLKGLKGRGECQIYYNDVEFNASISTGDTYKYRDYLGSLPEPFGGIFINSLKWRGCRKGECNGKSVEEFNGKKTVFCKWHGINYCSKDFTAKDLSFICEINDVITGKKIL